MANCSTLIPFPPRSTYGHLDYSGLKKRTEALPQLWQLNIFICIIGQISHLSCEAGDGVAIFWLQQRHNSSSEIPHLNDLPIIKVSSASSSSHTAGDKCSYSPQLPSTPKPGVRPQQCGLIWSIKLGASKRFSEHHHPRSHPQPDAIFSKVARRRSSVSSIR